MLDNLIDKRAFEIAKHQERALGLLAFHKKIKNNVHDTAIKEKALHKIALWRSEKLCSKWYADTWEDIILGGPEVYSARILNGGSDANALMQNTPFSFLMRSFSEN